MGLRSQIGTRVRAALGRSAAQAPVPVFPLVGQGARAAVQDLRLDDRLRLVESPRQAEVLLLAGAICGPLLRPALRIHDELARPRATIWWPLGAPARRLAQGWPGLAVVSGGQDLADTLLACHRALLRGERPSDPPFQPDLPPAPWRGVGPYGQGGKGMTGGVPYGRPVAGTAPDRDGLQLDQLPVRLGPWFPVFPPGLILDVALQGDVLQGVAVGPNPFGPEGAVGVGSQLDGLLRSALAGPVEIRDLELARARHHLRWLADALRLAGLDAMGRRALRLAVCLQPGDAGAVRQVGVAVERLRSLAPATADVGVLESKELGSEITGPVARASGRTEDARSGDPAYLALGFEPVTHREADARARWRQRLAEAEQALALASRAGTRRTELSGVVESPWGRLTSDRSPMAPLLALLPRLLAGQEWGDAMTSVVSLDLELDLEVGVRAGASSAGRSGRSEAA